MNNPEGGPRGPRPEMSVEEEKEMLDKILKEADPFMDALFNGNDEETWNGLRAVMRKGINAFGRTRFRELLDKAYGEGAGKNFVKENESDPE